MKSKRKTKPRVTQLDRIEARLRKINLAFDGVEHYIELRQHCAVLASHNRRLLEENDTLRRWLKRLQKERGDSICPECHQHYGWHALDCKLNGYDAARREIES